MAILQFFYLMHLLRVILNNEIIHILTILKFKGEISKKKKKKRAISL